MAKKKPKPIPVPLLMAELETLYPDPRCELHFQTPLQLLVATILSAQCTDVRVNLVTPALFRKYPDAQAYAQAKLPELEALIRSTGFYRNKARNICECCKVLVNKYDGHVPRTLEELVALPGVGRKTANVVLGDAFGIPGITVDTHCGRLARRWGLTQQLDAVKVEMDLNAIIPQPEWTHFSHRAILHGRRVCGSRRPNCPACTLAPLCPKVGVTPRIS